MPSPRPANLPTWVAVRDPLGPGGTASVRAARDRRSGRDVVVKVVDLAAHPMRPGRFEREARALARLGGRPGVPAVLAVGVDPEGLGWLVLERVPGPDLAAVVAAGGPMAPGPVADLGARLAEVLAEVHAAGIVHGDVSPANVVPTDPPAFVDFGVGGVGDPAPAGDVALTPAYAAPERRRGGPPGPATDVYGLAATLWFALTGAAPGPAPGARAPVDPPAPAPGDRAGGDASTPDAVVVAGVLFDALRDDPARRPDAAVLARSLAAAVPTTGRGGTPAGRGGRGRRRRR